MRACMIHDTAFCHLKPLRCSKRIDNSRKNSLWAIRKTTGVRLKVQAIHIYIYFYIKKINGWFGNE